MPVNAELRSLDIAIPAKPQALVELSLLLADEDVNLDAVARLIEGDMALAAAVLKAVNSSLYGLRGRVQTVQQAITYLGTREVVGIAYEMGLRAAFGPADELDPLWQRSPTWRGQRVNLPLTAQRILATLVQHRGQVVSYEQLFDVVKSGRNRDNVRKHVATIRDALRDVDPEFDGLENVPMRGFRWVA
jgi:hypothetical protein